MNFFCIFQTKGRKVKLHTRNCHSQPLNGQTDQVTMGLGKVWSHQSKVSNVFLALIPVETALASGGGTVYEK